ncbi:MAG: peptidylprolyl isomerase [Paracoccaceae bacterium]
MRIPALAAAAVVAALVVPRADAQTGTPFRPVATVNQAIITAYDVEQRARILLTLGAQPTSQQQLQNLALDELIEDRLKIAEGEANGIRVSPPLVEAGLERYAEAAGVTPEEFRAGMTEAGVSPQALEDLVVSDIVWRDVVRARFRGRVEPGEAEIDAEIALVRQSERTQYRLQEIGLPFAGNAAEDAEIRAFAEQLYRSLADGADFSAAVRRHSRAPSVRDDGNVGWVASNTLPPQLLEALSRLETGEVTPPQPVPGGLSILKVAEKREVGSEIDADDAEVRARVRRRLLNQRLELLAQGLIQERRRDALIEIR